MTAPDRIAGMTLAEWREFARLDNCLEIMVPSELRLLIAAIPEPRATPAAMTPENKPHMTRLWQEQVDARRAAEARAERLEAALRFYANDETYETQYWRRSCGCCTDIFEPINDDRGAKARAALLTEKPHDRA